MSMYSAKSVRHSPENVEFLRVLSSELLGYVKHVNKRGLSAFDGVAESTHTGYISQS
jgi:hypothetical protein